MADDSIRSLPCQRDAQWQCALAPDGDLHSRVDPSMVRSWFLLVDSDDETMVKSEEKMTVVRAGT